jgi:hypothetical protein
MRTLVRGLFVLALLMLVATVVYLAAPAATPATAAAQASSDDGGLEVLHVFQCGMKPGVTEEQVDTMAQAKLKALQQMPGGEKARVHILWPVAVSNMGTTDFQIVWTFPSFADWGKLWDAYSDDSPLARDDDATEGKVACPDSMIWEAHPVVVPKK